MLRQASGRNHRSKGFKVKHALQICLLVAICIWLLYQVKHSHEKKRAFEERNSNISNKVTENQADFFKFGRKDLPHAEKTGSVNESQNKEDENEETIEEHDIKQEEIEDEEGRGAGDDEIDEQDQDKGDEESGHGEESTDEVDKDNHEEDRDSHDEDEDGHDEVHMFDNQEHEGGTQEAREENYKRDDASSAVHDAHETESETGSGGVTNAVDEQVVDKVDDDSGANGSKPDDDSSVNGAKGDIGASADGSNSEVVAENVEKKVVESENVTNGSDDGSRGDNDFSAGSGGASVRNVSDTVVNETIQTGNLSSNVTAAVIKDAEVDNKDVEVEFSKPDNGIASNSTAVEGNNQMEQQANLMTAAESNTQMELLTNSTGSLGHQIEMQNNSTVVYPAGLSTSNNTASLVSAQNQNFTTNNATPEEDAHSSQNMEGQTENSDTTSSVLESEEHSTTSTTDENGDAAQGGSDKSEHAAITEEEKDARMDLSTLPDIQNEANTTDDEAAE